MKKHRLHRKSSNFIDKTKTIKEHKIHETNTYKLQKNKHKTHEIIYRENLDDKLYLLLYCDCDTDWRDRYT